MHMLLGGPVSPPELNHHPESSRHMLLGSPVSPPGFNHHPMSSRHMPLGRPVSPPELTLPAPAQVTVTTSDSCRTMVRCEQAEGFLSAIATAVGNQTMIIRKKD